MKSFFFIVGVIVYVICSILVIPFLSFSFGARPTVIEEVVGFIIKFPIGFLIKDLSKGGVLVMLILNGIFWNAIVMKCIDIVRQIKFRR